MPVYLYDCPLCKAQVEDDRLDRDGSPCPNPCEGALRRVYSLFVKRVDGAGGSPGKAIGGNR